MFYSEPFFIYKYRPIKTKFHNDINIKTTPFLETNNENKREILDLLRSNYISNDRILLTLRKKDFDTIYTGHIESSYLSIYKNKKYSIVENLDINKLPILGCILSNSIQFYYQGSPQDNMYTELQFYYIDYLCVQRELDQVKKTKYIRELFQTHEYNQRLYNPAIQGSLFKREINLLEGVIPLVKYSTYVYYLRDLKFPSLPAHFHVVQITLETIDILTDFLYVQTHLDLIKSQHYTILSVTNLGNYVEMIKKNITYVFCLKKGEHIYGAYFFRDSKMQYEDLEGNTLQFYGSICNTDTPNIFYLGFLHSIYQILKKFPKFKMLLFENLGDNIIIHEKWREKNTRVFENKTAYYTFNLIFPGSPIQPGNCLFL
jgi:hypothetical protein